MSSFNVAFLRKYLKQFCLLSFLVMAGCTTLKSQSLSFSEKNAPYAVRKKITLIIGNFDSQTNRTAKSNKESEKLFSRNGRELLRAYLYQIPNFDVHEELSDDAHQNTSETLQSNERQYIVCGNISEFGTKEFPEEYIFARLSRSHNKIVYAQIMLTITDPKNHRVIQTVNSAGEYLVATASDDQSEHLLTDPLIRNKALDIAIREGVRQLESELQAQAF